MAAQDKVTFKQDLTEPVKIRHYEGVVFTGDDCGNLIKVALFDGGVPYSGGGTVSATAVLADGTTFPLTHGSITGNMVSVPLEAGALAVSGLMGLYVKISGDGIICTVLNAIFTVQATDTGMVPAAMVTTVNELVAAIRDAQASIPADLTNLLAAVAPTFSTSTAYSAGAYVWQDGVLYRFTAAHPAGTWTGTDAVQVALGNDVADLKSAFNNNRRITVDGIALGYYPLYFETVTGGFGGTVGTTYTETTSQTRTRWSDFVPVSLFERIQFELDDYSLYDYYVIGVDDNNSIVYSTGWKHAKLAVNGTGLSGATKIRMMIRKQTEIGYIANESMWLHAIVTFRPSVNANLSYKRVIVATDDLNNLTNPGIYYYSSSVHPQNEPFGTGSILLVYGYSSTTATVQIAIGYGADNDNSHQFAHRELTSGGWSSWRYIQQEQKEFLAGKTFSILGDSISSFSGYVPTGYASHYPAGDVTAYTDTWWGMLMAETGIALDINNSYSGSPLCETGTLTERPRGASDERINNLGTNPDYIVIFMGTNDMNQNANVGSYNISDSFPSSIDTFRGALAIALKKIANNHSNAKVIVCTVPECYPYRLASSATDNPFWTNTQTQTISNLNKAILEIAPEFGALIADLRQIYNTKSRNDYTHDGGVTEGLDYTFGVHPNKAGMERIKSEILKAMQ